MDLLAEIAEKVKMTMTFSIEVIVTIETVKIFEIVLAIFAMHKLLRYLVALVITPSMMVLVMTEAL